MWLRFACHQFVSRPTCSSHIVQYMCKSMFSFYSLCLVKCTHSVVTAHSVKESWIYWVLNNILRKSFTMALIHKVSYAKSCALAILVLICCSVYCTSTGSNKLGINTHLVTNCSPKVCLNSQLHVKYVGKRISYYPTPTYASTFQLSFVQCGDIHPNPGPSSNSKDPNTNTSIVDRISMSTCCDSCT